MLTDDYTARTATEGAPQYRVLILDDDGIFQQRSGYFVPDIEGQEAKLRAESAELAADIRAAEEEGSIVHRRQQFEEKKAAYEERKGKPRKAVPRREVLGTLVEAVTGVGEAIERTGKRQRSALLEDIERREAEE